MFPFVAAFFLFLFGIAVCEKPKCETTRPPEPPANLLDGDFWEDMAGAYEKCMKNATAFTTENAKNRVEEIVNAQIAMSAAMMAMAMNPCQKTVFERFAKTGPVKNLRKAIGMIPVVGDPLGKLVDIFTGEDPQGALKDEIWKAQEATLCALNLQTEEIRGMISNQTQELKEYIDKLCQKISDKMDNFQAQMSESFAKMDKELQTINRKLDKVLKVLAMQEIHKIFDNVEAHYQLYAMGLKEPENAYLHYERCKDNKLTPLSALIDLSVKLQRLDDMESILAEQFYTDEAFDSFTKLIVEKCGKIIELYFNCRPKESREVQLKNADERLEAIEKQLDFINEMRKEWYFSNRNMQSTSDNLAMPFNDMPEFPKAMRNELNNRYKNFKHQVDIYHEYSNSKLPGTTTFSAFSKNATHVDFTRKLGSHLRTQKFLVLRTKSASNYESCDYIDNLKKLSLQNYPRYVSTWAGPLSGIWKTSSLAIDYLHSKCGNGVTQIVYIRGHTYGYDRSQIGFDDITMVGGDDRSAEQGSYDFIEMLFVYAPEP